MNDLSFLCISKPGPYTTEDEALLRQRNEIMEELLAETAKKRSSVLLLIILIHLLSVYLIFYKFNLFYLKTPSTSKIIIILD